MAVQSAALSLASGGHPIWDRFPTGRRARVIHIDHYNGARAIQRRYQRLSLGMGLSPDELRGYLRVVSGPKTHLTDSRARDAYRRAVEGWDLCILDSPRGFTTSGDENDTRLRDCFEQVLMPVSEDTGCAFIVLHHLGNGAAQLPDNDTGSGGVGVLDGAGSQLHFTLHTARGGSGRVAGVDGDDGDEATNAGGFKPELRRVAMAKAAAESTGVVIAPFYLDFEDVPENEAVNLKAGVRVVYRAEEHTKTADRREGALDQALSYVRARTLAHEPVRGIEDLAKGLHVHRRTASDAVAQLVRDKLIANEPEKIGRGSPKPRLWALSAENFVSPPRRRGAR
jgi:hypothetical protein